MTHRWTRDWLHYTKFGEFGKWVFSKFYGFHNSYAGTIKPRILDMKPGFAAVSVSQRWSIQNHIGTIHAIAVCNLVDTCAKMVSDVSLNHRYVFTPVGLDVNYRKKCKGTLTATANLDAEKYAHFDKLPCTITIPVEVHDKKGELVTDATVRMLITAKTHLERHEDAFFVRIEKS